MTPDDPEEPEAGSTAIQAMEARLRRARRNRDASVPFSPAWDAARAEVEQLEAHLAAMGRDPGIDIE